MKKIKLDVEYAKELFDSGVSMHKIAEQLNCSFTKIQKELNSYEFNKNNPYKSIEGKQLIAICKQTNKEFIDYDNRSGAITNHLLKIYSDLEIPSNYKRKDILHKTFKFWYHDYFEFGYRDIKSTLKCKYCDWETEDVDNLAGLYMNHMLNIHNIDIDEHIYKYPDDGKFFKNYIRKKQREEFLNHTDNHVECKICGKKLKKITESHVNKHNMTLNEYRIKFNLNNAGDIISKKERNDIIRRRKTTFKPKKIYKRSKGEDKIIEFLQEHDINIISNERNLLDGFEVDIYLPNYNIGIEYNGAYFHSEYNGKKDINYHKAKTNLLESKNIKLIHLFDSDINNNIDKVKKMLLDFIGINLISITENDYIIEYINEETKNNFISDNSINIIDVSKYNIGCLVNKEIVSLMCFDFYDNEIIINNYINKLGYKIENDYKLIFNKIKSEFDVKIFKGYYNKLWNNFENNIFEKLGFIKNKNTDPDFYYIKFSGSDKNRLIIKNIFTEDIIKQRFHEIYSENKTIDQMLFECGYDRLWDSGKIEYIYNLDNTDASGNYYLELNTPINKLIKHRPPKYKENINKITKSKKPSRKVAMIDLDGNLIKIYNSTKDCAVDNGYTYNQIYSRLKGIYENNLNIKFIYLKDYKDDYDLEKDLYILPDNIENNVFIYKKQRVVVTDSKNNYINIFKSTSDAEKFTDVHKSVIRKRANGEYKNVGDFNFYWESDWNSGNLKEYVESSKFNKKRVAKYYIDSGEVIETYDSMYEAAKKNNINESIVRRRCRKDKIINTKNSKIEENISYKFI
jgi:hypothetical protein